MPSLSILAIGSHTFRAATTCGLPTSCRQLRYYSFPGGWRYHSLLIGLGGCSGFITDHQKRRVSTAHQVHAFCGGWGKGVEKSELMTFHCAVDAKTQFDEVENDAKTYLDGIEDVAKTHFDKVDDDAKTQFDEVEETLIISVGMQNERRRNISKRKGEQKTYFFAAIASTVGFTTLAVAAVVYRFIWQMPASGEIPYLEIVGTFSLAAGAAIGMEFWARWAHKALWHASLWNMHKSHHEPRDGSFETNDVFAIINAVPAISLMLYGFLNRGIVPGLCFGAGLGITMFGIAYMFVHDGLVHRRFPVGPIAGVPYLQKVAAAHQLHHADLFEGVPYGLFWGPKELEKVGGKEELQKLLKQRVRQASGRSPRSV